MHYLVMVFQTQTHLQEIGNNDNIVQIHGFGNKWLGNNPEAIPTVMRWIAANNLHCTDEILLSTAKGYYSGNASLVEKSMNILHISDIFSTFAG